MKKESTVINADMKFVISTNVIRQLENIKDILGETTLI